MKKFAQVTVIVLALLFATAQSASAGTGTGLFLGLVLGGASSNDKDKATPAPQNPEIIYQMPDMIERVTAPLEVRITCRYIDYATHSLPQRELLAAWIGKGQDVAILQVRMVYNPASTYAMVWFTFIDSKYIRPLPRGPLEK